MPRLPRTTRYVCHISNLSHVSMSISQRHATTSYHTGPCFALLPLSLLHRSYTDTKVLVEGYVMELCLCVSHAQTKKKESSLIACVVV